MDDATTLTSVVPQRTPAIIRHASPQTKAMTGVILLVLCQLIVWVVGVNSLSGTGTPLIPGNWSPDVPIMEWYFAAEAVAFGLLYVEPGRATWRKLVADTRLNSFCLRIGVWIAVGWAVLLGLTVLQTGDYAFGPALSDPARLQELLLVGLFVGPCEEVLFRTALPPRVGWVMGSCVLFALFHLPVYYQEYAGTSLSTVVLSLVELAVLGGILWWIYDRAGGWPSSTGFHVGWDWFTLGVLGGVGASVLALGLVPI